MDQLAARMTAPQSDTALATGHRAEYAEDKPLHEIEEDIARTRVRLTATIDALQCALTPARVVQKGADILRDAFEPGLGPLRDRFSGYVIPLAMIVAGLGWLVALRRNSWDTNLPSEFGELPAEAIETGETPAYADPVDPVEAVSLIDQTART